MPHVFRVDTSNTYISVSIFARQGPFSQVRSHIYTWQAADMRKLRMSHVLNLKHSTTMYKHAYQ